jgi:hypothetical protein
MLLARIGRSAILGLQRRPAFPVRMMKEPSDNETAPRDSAGSAAGNGSVEVTLKIPEDIQQMRKTGPCLKWKGASVDDLLASLWDLVLHLDLGSSLVWDEFSSLSSVKSKGRPDQGLTRCLTGHAEMSAGEFAQALERSKVLISALLLAVSGRRSEGFRGGIHQYALEFESKFRPEKIKDDADLEKNWYESLDKSCWRRYQKIAEDEEMAAEKIEYKVKRALAEEALWWMEASASAAEPS